MGEEQRLTENFCCAKCRGRTAVAKTTHLRDMNAGSLKKIFMPLPGKYCLLTCTLCGFTEIYDCRAYATATEEKPEAQPLPQEL